MKGMSMKTMKFIGLFLMAIVLGTQVMIAQDKQGNREGRKRISHEQMSKMKAERFAGELGLDDKKAALFKDAYIRYMSEMHELSMMNFPKRSEMGKGNKSEKKEWKAPTDEDVEKMIKGRFTQSRKMLDLREKYYDVFRKFLSPKQIQKVYDMEMNDSQRFHQEMNRRSGMKAPQGRQRPPMP